jgi:hypothetical protein
MKKIDLFMIQLPNKQSHYIIDKKYRIFLGNDCKVAFDNIKAAQQFLSETNLFLTQTLHELNDIYIQAFSMFRRYWFHFQRDTDNITDIIILIDKTFLLAVNRCHSPNSNYFIFNHLFSIIKNLSELLSLTYKVVQSKWLATDINLMNVYQLQLKRAYERIENWGKDGFKIQIVDDQFYKNLGKQTSFDFITENHIQPKNE